MKKSIILINKLIFCFFIFQSFNVSADSGKVTGLEIPRFVSIKSNDANLRIGPSINYPIVLKYIKKNLPVEVIEEFDVWRKIKDNKSNTGWLHKSLIKGDRYLLTITYKNRDIDIFNHPNGKKIGIVKKNNILKLERCLENWCLFNLEKNTGWILKENLWGVYKKEIYNLPVYQPILNKFWEIKKKQWFK